MVSKAVCQFLAILLATAFCCGSAIAQDVSEQEHSYREGAKEKRIQELEQMLEELAEEVRSLKEERSAERAATEREHAEIVELSARIDAIDASQLLDPDSWVNRLTIGGYGEFHANFSEGASGDQFDIHRLVLSLGYDFNDWIKFNSETEIEHAMVSDDSGGELVIEQAYLDFLLSDYLNIRAGRMLTPVGIINQKHEPPSFYGVERPLFARYIIPTTWSSDGAGIFGTLTPSLKYEAYAVGGLNGSGFDDANGIRDGRIKERPSLGDVAFTGRLDYYPFALRDAGHGQWLRLGMSTYVGGLDNGNEGEDPGVDGIISIYAADFEYTISRFDFRGEIAFENIGGARDIGNGTASEIFGWYLEGAYRFWRDSWRRGKLERADAATFLRFDAIDTQRDMPSGIARNPDGDREGWTIGMSFYPIPNLVVKADYQFIDSAGEDPGDTFNLGMGFQF